MIFNAAAVSFELPVLGILGPSSDVSIRIVCNGSSDSHASNYKQS
jgi:hypothetical protein